MGQLLISFLTVLLVSLSVQAQEWTPTGGGEPFGDIIDFPWDEVEGCWKSAGDNPLYVEVNRARESQEKTIQIAVNMGQGRATGSGVVKDRSVLAFLIGSDGTSDAKVFYSSLAAYCVKESEQATTCEDAMVITLAQYNDFEKKQSTYVLQPASSRDSCSFFN